jgi:SagB-type dehydrogenase family enzyme
MNNSQDIRREKVLDYHTRTKHYPRRYAPSLGYLDWANQPDPFRRYAGAPQVPLWHPPISDEPFYEVLFSPEGVPPRPLDYQSISLLLYDSLALSAWKQAPGTRPWSLRVNPSSGDLHPTEGYILTGVAEPLATHAAGVYHYSVYQHALERRLVLTGDVWPAIATQLPAGALLVALTTIYWREAWKYGERAFRYCHLDVGHAIGAIAFAAAALGWDTRLLVGFEETALAELLGLHLQTGAEAEHADCLLLLSPFRAVPSTSFTLRLSDWLRIQCREALWAGVPNRLSAHHHPWPILDEVIAATRFLGLTTGAGAQARWQASVPPPLEGQPISAGNLTLSRPATPPLSARRIIHQRRSAVAMDSHLAISTPTFYRLLESVSAARSARFPCRTLPWRPRVSLALFVHRVTGLEPGLYLLVRSPDHGESLRLALAPGFLWQKPAACPDHLDLFLLNPGDYRERAELISCHQAIAAEGVFSLGMLARFTVSLEQEGPWFYRCLYWECGLLGQALYLAAEAAGVRATGIGCYFDDLMHELLGLGDLTWQSLYHFTVGGNREDPRITTLEPYFHLRPLSGPTSA